MKVRRGLGLGLLFVMLLFAADAMAGDYGYMGGGYMNPRPMGGVSEIVPASSVAFTGTIAALNEDSHEVLVDTRVPGLLGPEERIVPFRINEDTTLTICFKSINSCESAFTGSEGWTRLDSLEQFYTLAGVKKDVVVVGDPNSDRIVHVQVTYEL